MPNRIYLGDNLPILQSLPSESVDLIYIDPPFNTGKTQTRTQIRTERSESGDRVGFQGKRYETVKVGSKGYADITWKMSVAFCLQFEKSLLHRHTLCCSVMQNLLKL